jgi:hypothetical protein
MVAARFSKAAEIWQGKPLAVFGIGGMDQETSKGDVWRAWK